MSAVSAFLCLLVNSDVILYIFFNAFSTTSLQLAYVGFLFFFFYRFILGWDECCSLIGVRISKPFIILILTALLILAHGKGYYRDYSIDLLHVMWSHILQVMFQIDVRCYSGCRFWS